MKRLASFVGGRFTPGEPSDTLVNPATEEEVAQAGSRGVDFRLALDYARAKGGPSLRAMTFAERGRVVKGVADVIQAERETLIELAVVNGGNTRSDAKFDVDGAIYTLATYAEIGAALGEARFVIDGEGIQLGRSPRFHGQHVFVPRAGVAVHINAFNFPAWGFAEKAAAALLAGMPVVSKPATSSALVAHRIVEALVETNVLPEGALSLIVGSVGDLLQHLTGQDVVAFTGSGETGARIRSLPSVIQSSVRVNVEADSLNAAVLGPDVELGSETYDLFLKDVLRDMTQKAGQKCTAIRRILVPEGAAARVKEDLVERLSAVTVGNPARDDVRMGPLATRAQLEDVRSGISRLASDGRLAFGGPEPVDALGVEKGKGFFVRPVLVEVDAGAAAPTVHSVEVFGPVATLVPYSGAPGDASEIVSRGSGGLVSSVYSDDVAWTSAAVFGLAPYHGRLYLGNPKIELAPGPGTVLPHLVHGGPGRAGGGEELGGTRALAFYSQRVALEGSRPVIEKILGAKST